LQTRRLAESFEQLSSFSVLELCSCKATCEKPDFVQTTWIHLATKVLKFLI